MDYIDNVSRDEFLGRDNVNVYVGFDGAARQAL